MDNTKDYNGCLAKLIGEWSTHNDPHTYTFHIEEYKGDEAVKNMYYLFAFNRLNGQEFDTFYKISSENKSYYIEFLLNKYKVLNIDHSIEIPEMELEDSDGNILLFKGF